MSHTVLPHSFIPTIRELSIKSSGDSIKIGIWVYIFFLIFEGAFRKWFMPSLSMPLLVVRDPIAIWLIYSTWKKGLLAFNTYTAIITVIGITAIFMAVFIGHGSLAVALFGSRILLIHFPLIFVIAKVFTKDDVIKLGCVLLWLSIPMTILLALQFFSPQSAFVNKGVGGDGSSGFDGALGYFRPSATFSFTNGTTLFYELVASYIFFFWIGSQKMNKVILIFATVALLISIPLSISRALLFQSAVCLLFALMILLRKPKYLGKVLIALVGVIALIIFISQYSFFQTATEVLTSRFDSAGTSEGGLKGTLVDRFLGGMITALLNSSEIPFWGFGIGMGTNVGSILLSGQHTFLIAEGEWARLIGELGPLMGLTIIFLRLCLCMNILLGGYRKMVKGDLLPWMLLSFALLTIPQAQWSQPTALGFSTLIAGLILASVKKDNCLMSST